MKMRITALAIIAAFLLPLSAGAFECPKIGKKAQAHIDEVSTMAKGKMSAAGIDGVEALLKNAQALLDDGMATHKGAKSKGDHAVSVAKINSADAYAGAAEALLKRL